MSYSMENTKRGPEILIPFHNTGLGLSGWPYDLPEEDTKYNTLSYYVGYDMAGQISKSMLLSKVDNNYEIFAIDHNVISTDIERPLKSLYVDQLSSGIGRLIFDKGVSLKVDISFEGGSFIAYNERFGLYGFGQSHEEALKDFEESFIEYYINIVNTPNTELGESTIKFKKVLQSFASFADYE
jgi:hypothetical protein